MSYEKSAVYCIFPLYHMHDIDSEHLLPHVKIVSYFHVHKNAQNTGKWKAINTLTSLLELWKKI